MAAVAAACAVAASVWARSARRLHRVWARVEAEYGHDHDAAVLARSAYRKEVHTAILYALVAVASLGVALVGPEASILFAFLVVPVLVSVANGRHLAREARIAEDRAAIERRAQEALDQQTEAPRAWAARLAPDHLPAVPGFEVGTVYEAGSGLMAGDFYDLVELGPHRFATLVGDVSGHGIEASITAFQAKYLMRVFLRQYRDPGQALEELNRQLTTAERGEEFISLCVVVFDTLAGTLRYASAGHPTAWLWHDRELRPLRATGPLLMLTPESTYYSREVELEAGDLLVMYTDGLAEARDDGELFGERRVADLIRRDPTVPPDVLCKDLLAAAKDFASAGLRDDVAIVAVKRKQ